MKAYQQLCIGDPLNSSNYLGPLIDRAAVTFYLSAIDQCKKEGGNFIVEGGEMEGEGYESGCFVNN